MEIQQYGLNWHDRSQILVMGKLWCRTSSWQGIDNLHGRQFLNKKMSRTLQYHWLREDTSVQMWALGEASLSLQLQRPFPVSSWALLALQWRVDPPRTICHDSGQSSGTVRAVTQRLPICSCACPDFSVPHQMPVGQRWHLGLSTVWGHHLHGPSPSATLLH